MKVSVIAVTARMGCFDVLVNCMEAQTFPKGDFEVVVVDSFYDERKDFVKDRLPKNFRHVGLPEDRPWYDACYATNVGIREATGELAIIFSDLNWAYPAFIKDHWGIYQQMLGYSMTGYCYRYQVPKLKLPKFVSLGVDNGEKNIYDWADCAWSIFEEEFTHERAWEYFSENEPTYRETKGGTKGSSLSGLDKFWELPGEYFYGSLNESIPMQVLKDIGGLDERYDGAYGVADIDLGWRANKIGWKFMVDPGSITRKLGQKSESGVIPAKNKSQTRTTADNMALFQERKRRIEAGKESVRTPEGHGLA